jgi:hypothetical protein
VCVKLTLLHNDTRARALYSPPKTIVLVGPNFSLSLSLSLSLYLKSPVFQLSRQIKGSFDKAPYSFRTFRALSKEPFSCN